MVDIGESVDLHNDCSYAAPGPSQQCVLPLSLACKHTASRIDMPPWSLLGPHLHCQQLPTEKSQRVCTCSFYHAVSRQAERLQGHRLLG